MLPIVARSKLLHHPSLSLTRMAESMDPATDSKGYVRSSGVMQGAGGGSLKT